MAKIFILLIYPLLGIACSGATQTTESTPNVVLILVDDLGYADIGINGQKYIETPYLDQLAREGLVLTQFYSGSPVCAPSRSALMTGMHTGHTHIRGNKEIQPEGQEPILDSLVTIAEVLKSAGYTTGAFGKWGLGFINTEGDPLNQGFDRFYGYNCQRQSHRYFPPHLWDNDTMIKIPNNNPQNVEGYAPDIIQREALSFIETNANKPFFLFLPYTLPHAELVVPDDSLFKKYKGKFEEVPFQGNDYKQRETSTGYASQEYPKAAYAAMVNRIDVYVGQVMEKLKELGLEENTLVIFTSDNGPAKEGGADPDFFNSNGIFRGYKRDVYEGGIRVPFIAKWPGRIVSESKSDHIGAFWDLLPTLADIVSQDVPANIDGLSLLPAMTGEGEQEDHEYLYWEFHEQGGKQAVRKGKWKAVRLQVKTQADNAPIELYDLDEDPSEQYNIASKHPELVDEMLSIMKNARTESEIFPFLTMQ
ncbi:arylsulfatase [Albibacterium indicum]|uniref:arylsulfatase n=1 Tax=Albibacterium indicum TaxID=2292082 RepID=UPI000E4A0C42|nr:arylsulfatase [Pedobacter indicus]